MSNALLNLFLLESKPENPIEIVRDNIDLNLSAQIGKLKNEVEQAKKMLAQLNARVSEMRKLEHTPTGEQEPIQVQNIEMVENNTEFDLIDCESMGKNSQIIDDDLESTKELGINNISTARTIHAMDDDNVSKNSEKTTEMSEMEMSNE